MLSKHEPGLPGLHSPHEDSAEGAGVEPARPFEQALFENAAAAIFRLDLPPNLRGVYDRCGIKKAPSDSERAAFARLSSAVSSIRYDSPMRAVMTELVVPLCLACRDANMVETLQHADC